MKRVTLHVTGSVQSAGYRSRVVTIANAFGIRGSIQNLPDGRVKIIAEGDEKDLERFIQAVDIKNALINVTSIEKEYSTPSGDYVSFYKLVGGGETDERLDTAADLLKELIHTTKNGFEAVGGKVDKLGDELGGKIDGLGGKIDGLGGKIDGLEKSLGGKIDQNREEITSEIHSLRDGFRSHFDERLTNVEFELAEIKAKVAAPVTASPLPPNPKTRTPPARSASTSTPPPAEKRL